MSERDNILYQPNSGTNLDSVQQNLQKLIRECIAQNRTAQKNLYTRYAPFLYGVIKRYTYNSGQADEILNDSFYKILTGLPGYTFKGSFEGWIRRIAINTITDHFRKYTKNEPAYKAEIDEVDVHIKDDAVSKLGYKELLNLIYQLPDTQRAVFNLFVFEDFSHKEIATHLGINENNARWHLNDARKRLKEKITSMQS